MLSGSFLQAVIHNNNIFCTDLMMFSCLLTMQLAERYVHQLRCIDVKCEERRSWTWRIEEAWVFWCRDETETAKHIMKQLIRKLESVWSDLA